MPQSLPLPRAPRAPPSSNQPINLSLYKMRLELAPIFFLLALTPPVLASPIEKRAQPVCYPITNSSPTVANIIGAENKLIAKGSECYQGDTYNCQDHAVYNGARIQICGQPLWHAPCWVLANIAKQIRTGCTKNGRATGQLVLTGGGKVIVG